MELMGPESKRIKLEHSYALICDTLWLRRPEPSFENPCPRIEEEDPLKISPEDFLVKTEIEEDIVIKLEVPGENGTNQSIEHLNSPSVSHQSENHYHSNNTTLVPEVSNEQCESNNQSLLDSLELEDDCDMVNEINDSIPTNNELFDSLPKPTFWECQQNCEKIQKTIKGLEHQNQKLFLVADRLERTKPKAQYVFGSPLTYDAEFFKISVLELENKRLKEEVKALKEKEKLLEMRVNMREQDHKTINNSIKLLRERCENDADARVVFLEKINKLKELLGQKETQLASMKQLRSVVRKDSCELKRLRAQLSAQEAQSKESKNKCLMFFNKLTELGAECAKYKSAQAKAEQDLANMEKELADSIRIREILTERSFRLNKKLLESKNNLYKDKFQETQAELLKSVQHAKVIEQCYNAERKKNLFLAKERNQLMEEQQNKYNHVNKELLQAHQNLSVSRTMLSRKMAESNNLREAFNKLVRDYNLKDREFKKKEEEMQRMQETYKTRVCEYCGF